MADIAELVIKVDASDGELAKRVLDRLSDSGARAGGTADVVTSQFGRLMAVLGPAALVGAMTLAVRGALNLQDSYVRLSEVAGTTASRMSAFDLSARLSGTSMDAVAQSVARLGKAIGDARLGDVQKQGIFSALGIDVNDGRDAAEVMVDVSKAVMGMKDQNVAASISQSLLSRGFAEMRPFMKEIVEQGTLVARVTDAEARAAKEFMDELEKLKFELQGNAISLSQALLPALREAARIYRELKEQVGGTETVAEVAKAAFRGLASVVYVVADAFFQVGRTVGGIAAAIVAFAQKDYPLAGSIVAQVAIDIEKNTRRTTENIKKLWEDARPPRMPPAVLDRGPGGSSEAEERVRRMMEFARTYEAQVQAEKGFAERYSEAIKITNEMTRMAREQGLISDETTIAQLGANEAARLRVLADSIEKQRQLHETKGDAGKAQEAADALASVNAQIVANEVITAAKISSLRAASDAERKINLAQGINDLQVSMMSEAETLEHHYIQRQNLIDAAMQENLISDEQWQVLMARTHMQFEVEKTRITDEETKKRFGISQVHRQLDLAAASTFFGHIGSLMNTQSRKMFEIGKAGAIGETVINTYRAAQGAYAALSGIPIVGPALGVAAAAAEVLAGLARVQAIRSQQFGAGGGAVAVTPVTPSGLGAPPPTPNTPPPGGGSSQSPTQVVVNVHITGNVTTPEFLDDVVIPHIREAVNNRDVLLFNQNSRQATVTS